MDEPITIGELVSALRECREDARVYFDFPSFEKPTRIASYRGYYNRAALGFERGDWGADDAFAHKLAVELEHSLLETHEGWKGGDYRYGPKDNLFVANPGETSDVLVVGLMDEGHKATILTRYLPDFY